MKPTIHVVSRPMIDIDGIDTYLGEQGFNWHRTSDTTDAEEVIEFSGRICYLSFGDRQSPRTNGEYIRNLIEQGHDSVLEHAVWTFIISGVTRSFTHQLVRHRVGFSYSQLSQQYVDHASSTMSPIVDLGRYPTVSTAWHNANIAARKSYSELKQALEEDVSEDDFPSKKERNRFINSIARQVLPNATCSTIVFSANARSIRHFLEVRGSTEGDLEMRLVSTKLLEIMKKEAPSVFEDFHISSLPDGTEMVVKS